MSTLPATLRMNQIMRWIFVISVVAFSCGRSQDAMEKESSTDSSLETLQKPAVDSVLHRDFDAFFARFRADSIFQVNQIRFPLEMKLWIEVEQPLEKQILNQADWRYSSFYYESQFATRPIDAYTQTVKSYGDTVKLEIRGVDNGIYTDYNFFKIDGDWTLVSIEDYTN